MNNLREDTGTLTSHSEALARICAIVNKACGAFTPERIEKIIKSIYGANVIIANEDAVTKKIIEAIEQVIVSKSAESRLFRKVGTPFTCVIPNDYKQLPATQKAHDSLVAGQECLVTFLEIRVDDVQYADAVDFLVKAGALFPGAPFLHYLNQFHTDKISTFQCLYILDREPSVTMHQLFGGRVTEIATTHGICDLDILVFVTKI